jgi:hypothetical protein
MNLSPSPFFSLLLILSAAACHTTIPIDRATVFYDRATFTETVQQDTGQIEDPILQHGRCDVYLSTPDANVTTNHKFCIYALTEKHLFVQEWDLSTAKYIPFLTIDFAKLLSVDWAFYFRSKQVKFLEPQRLIGFSAVIDGGGYIDGEATETIFKTVKAQGIPSTGNDRLLRSPPAPMPIMIPIVIPRIR